MDCARRYVCRRDQLLNDGRSVHCRMRGKYVAEVKEIERKPGQSLIVCYDDVGCTSAIYNGEAEAANALWYQYITSKRQRKLIVSYKVCYYLQPNDRAKFRRETALSISQVAKSTESSIY